MQTEEIQAVLKEIATKVITGNGRGSHLTKAISLLAIQLAPGRTSANLSNMIGCGRDTVHSITMTMAQDGLIEIRRTGEKKFGAYRSVQYYPKERGNMGYSKPLLMAVLTLMVTAIRKGIATVDQLRILIHIKEYPGASVRYLEREMAGKTISSLINALDEPKLLEREEKFRVNENGRRARYMSYFLSPKGESIFNVEPAKA